MTDFNSNNCNSDLLNTGRCGCDQVLTGIEYVVFAKKIQEFATKTDAETEANWLTDIQKKEVYPFFQIHETEDLSTEDGTFSGANGLVVIPTSKGKWMAKFHFQIPAYNLTRLYSFDGASGRMYLADSQGHVMGTTEDNTKFRGFEIRRIMVSKPKLALTKDEVVTVAVSVEFSKIDEYTKELAIVDCDFIDSLEGLQNVDVTYVSTNAGETETTITVTRECDSTGVSGLVAADFTLLSDGGDVIAITSVTESATVAGTYVVVTAALADDDYLINIVAPSIATTQGYESTGSATFTITT
jgi:hypothetical protein